MKPIFTFIGLIMKLAYIHSRRLVPARVRRWLLTIMRPLLPGFIKRRLLVWHTDITNLSEEDGLRGMSTRYGNHFTEFVALMQWMLLDKDKPSLKESIFPTLLKFAGVAFQAITFSIVVGYISMAANDWQFTWDTHTIHLPPTTQNIFIITLSVFVFYTASALLNYFGGNMMLNIGLKYQNVLSERLLRHYKKITIDSGGTQYLDSTLLFSILNSECRYLGRALIMLYNVLYQAVIAIIGLVALLILDNKFALICIGFIVVATLMQVTVMGKTLNDTRDMLRFSADNSYSLRNAVAAISLNPKLHELSDDQVNTSLQTQPITDYNAAYYARLRIALFSSTVPQLIFAIFVAGLFGYSVYAIQNLDITTTSAIQYVFSLRFFFGGIAGILGGFVSIISFKPFFDNYLQIITLDELKASQHNITDVTEAASSEGRISEENELTFSKNAGGVKVQRNEFISVIVNNGAIAWLDIGKILDMALSKEDRVAIRLSEDISIVHTEFPLLFNNPFYSLDLQPDALNDGLLDTLPYPETIITELKNILTEITANPDRAAALWQQMQPPHYAAASLLAAIQNKKPIIFFSERALRSVAERDRDTMLAPLADRFLFLHHNTLPTVLLRPSSLYYLIFDHEGVFGCYAPDEILDIPSSTISKFKKSSLGEDMMAGMMESEL